ncbi:DNA polymerase III subunit chi [Caenibius tardaugens NBRC 16725]|uniref:DNA polymerase III subunit chi n=1 Tax=Caenibius tardaugens NBRC 16725 TaxID=1219035 RepID=U2YHK0_9SPHN|nr:DNA polymerase III subunit chi [Caenibius tardaugens]AZI37373.1 DNA polymerase III subunit chi [Caenibius tardaugens NBRC 16725]GAD47367.1 DNA polymerase III subunit chi [Caenibius tardaugens NBRC 16725]
MRVDFYQLSRDPVELVVPLIARATRAAGERLLVVSDDDAALERIDTALWERLPEAFLAHGRAGQPHAARQPVLLSETPEAGNGAGFIALADGKWRDEAAAFARVFLLFGDGELDGARACWRMLGGMDGVERKFWKQDGGKWREGP